jgi:hypothetical protein
MSLGLARRHPAVVAGHAGAGRNTGMAVGCGCPTSGAMAAFARSSGWNMSLGLCGCAHAVAWHVTGGTIPRSSLEDTLHMAGLAPNQNVRTGQVETGLDMVEFYGAGTGSPRSTNDGQHHQRQKQEVAELPGETRKMNRKFSISFMLIQFAAP